MLGDRWPFWLAAVSLALARIMQTVALFLPIKLLMLLSGSSAPSILQVIPIDPGALMIIMMALVPVLYAGSVLVMALFQSIIDRRPSVPIPSIRADKINLKLFLRLREAMVRNAADMLVIVLGAIGVLTVHVAFGIASIVVLALYCVALEIYIFSNPKPRHTFLKITPTQLIEYSRSFVFILLFGVLAYFVFQWKMNVYIAILCLLVCRLMTQSAQRFFNAAIKLRKAHAMWIHPSAIGALETAAIKQAK
jgi:hypothetical protein